MYSSSSDTKSYNFNKYNFQYKKEDEKELVNVDIQHLIKRHVERGGADVLLVFILSAGNASKSPT